MENEIYPSLSNLDQKKSNLVIEMRPTVFDKIYKNCILSKNHHIARLFVASKKPFA